VVAVRPRRSRVGRAELVPQCGGVFDGGPDAAWAALGDEGLAVVGLGLHPEAVFGRQVQRVGAVVVAAPEVLQDRIGELEQEAQVGAVEDSRVQGGSVLCVRCG
jgi:hypothetical protein